MSNLTKQPQALSAEDGPSTVPALTDSDCELNKAEVNSAFGGFPLHWTWTRFDTKFLGPDVYSEVTYFPEAFALTSGCVINRFERVFGRPSQLSFFQVPTAWLFDYTKSMDAIIKDVNFPNLEKFNGGSR